MFNKKLALMVLSAAALGLASCGGGNNEQSSSASSGTTSAGSQESTVTIPTEEGKISIYFTWVDFTYVDDAGETQESIKLADLPEYCAPFITGAWYDGDWADFKLEMTRIPDTAVFYAMIDADSDLGDLGYQITLGYSAASGVSAAKQGINWSYKTAYSEDYFPGLDHPIMTKIADNLYECASDKEDAPMGFKSILPKPVEVKNLSVKFMMEADEELNMDDKENLEYVVKGSFDNWEVHSVGEADEEGYYTLEMGDVIAGTFEFCFGVHNKLLGGMDDAYNFMHVDMEGVKVSGKGATYTEVYDEDDEDVLVEVGVTNYQINVLGTTKADTVLNLGKFANPKKMMKDGEVVAYELPSDEAPTMDHSVIIEFENTAEVAAEGVMLEIIGDFTSAWADPQPMDVITDGKLYQYVIPAEMMYLGQKQNFKIRRYTIKDEVREGDWAQQIGLPAEQEGGDLSNIVLTPTVGEACYKVSAELVVDPTSGSFGKAAATFEAVEYTFAEEESMEVRVYNVGEGTPEGVYIAGEIPGWGSGDADIIHTPMVLDDEGGYYVYELAVGGLVAGSKTAIKVTCGNWSKNIGTAGMDYQLYLGAGYIALEGDLVNFSGSLTLHAFPVL